MAAAPPAAPPPLLQLQTLHHGFAAFLSATPDCAWDGTRARLADIQGALAAGGAAGSAALALLQAHAGIIGWQSMCPERFARFYRFAFIACREPGRRNLCTHAAVALWQLLLRGRFRLLERWCIFVLRAAPPVVTEDTWRQARSDLLLELVRFFPLRRACPARACAARQWRIACE